MLHLNNVSVDAGRRRLLDIDSLDIWPGEMVGIVGPNGAGKSTLLKVCSGEQIADEGVILLEGTPMSEWSKNKLAQKRAVLPQNSSLMFEFSAFDVVLMGRCPFNYGAFNKSDKVIVEQVMKITDTVHLAEQSYPVLSGGEKQRVQLARVLAQIWREDKKIPRYLMLDEPTSALDIAHQHQTLAIAKRFTIEQNVASIVILHDLNLAAQYVDRLVILKAGKVVTFGSPRQVLNEQTVEDVFQHPVSVVDHPELLDTPLVVTSKILDPVIMSATVKEHSLETLF